METAEGSGGTQAKAAATKTPHPAKGRGCGSRKAGIQMPRVKSGEPPRPTIGVKYPLEVQSRIHAVAKMLEARAGGTALPISNVMTTIVTRGLADLEKEFNAELTATKPNRKSTAA